MLEKSKIYFWSPSCPTKMKPRLIPLQLLAVSSPEYIPYLSRFCHNPRRNTKVTREFEPFLEWDAHLPRGTSFCGWFLTLLLLLSSLSFLLLHISLNSFLLFLLFLFSVLTLLSYFSQFCHHCFSSSPQTLFPGTFIPLTSAWARKAFRDLPPGCHPFGAQSQAHVFLLCFISVCRDPDT